MSEKDKYFAKNRKVSLFTDRNHRHFRKHPHVLVCGGVRAKLTYSKTVVTYCNSGFIDINV